MIETKKVGWTGHVAHKVGGGGRKKKCIQSFSRKPEGKRLLGGSRHRREHNIKMDTEK
jgi:hypothetical protein